MVNLLKTSCTLKIREFYAFYTSKKLFLKKTYYWKGRNKTFIICRQPDGVYIINFKMDQLLELISEFSKVTGYKVSIENKLYFCISATDNENKTISFRIASKKSNT